MRRRSSWVLFSLFALAACSKTGEREAETRGADTTSGATSQGAGPQAIVTVLYNTPKDTAAFEKYYATTHLPLLFANQDQIGFVRADFTRFSSTAEGKKPTFYRQAELYFNSMDALRKGVATDGFKQVGDDLKKFATGGFLGMTALETGEKGTAACPALPPRGNPLDAAGRISLEEAVTGVVGAGAP